MEKNMTFKEKLVKLRKLKGLTQDEFASAVGVSRQAVYKWESGQSYPEVSKLIEMKLLFGISIDDLLDENYEVIVPEKKRKRRLSEEKKREIEAMVRAEEEAREAEEAVVYAVAEEAAPIEEAVTEEAPSPEEAPAQEAAPVKEEPAKEKRGLFRRMFGR